MRAAIVQNFVLGILFGLIYLQLDKDQEGIQNRMGGLFFIVANQGLSAATSVVNTFAQEKAIFLRENGNWMYRTTAFYLAKTVADLPFQVLYPFIFATITYWMIGFQRDGGAFLQYLLLLLLTALCGGSVGLTVSTLAPNASVAVALIPMTVIPFMIFGGLFVNPDTLPVYLVWAPYVSFMKWGYEGLVLNEFTGLEFTCSEDQQIGGVCPLSTGEEVIKSLSFEDASLRNSYLVLISMVVLLRGISYVALLYRARTANNNA